MDFKELAQRLLPQAKSLVPQWLPQGKLQGTDWVIGNIQGQAGQSMHINLETGMWKDFATKDKGGDLISLYAAIKNIDQYPAALELGGTPEKKIREDLPDFIHKTLGFPRSIHQYTDSNNIPVMYTARYDKPDGKKEFLPFTYVDNKWIKKSIKENRPLFGLYELTQNPDAPVLIVEGERTCELAREFIEPYVIVSWSGGCQATAKTDWSPIFNRKKVLLWPDADEAGIGAMEEIASILSPHVEEIKIIRPDRNSGWDAADAYQEGWTYDQWKSWAKVLVETYAPVPAITVHAPEVEECFEVKVPKNMVELIQKDIDLFKTMGLILNSKLKPITNEANILRVLNKWDKLPRDLVHFDTFLIKLIKSDGKEWEDNDLIQLLLKIQTDLKLHNLSKTTLETALMGYAYKNKRNQLTDWLSTLQWDMTDRVDTFFHKYMGAEDTPYTRAISRNFWVGLLARATNPGCKLDTMVVLEGAQGARKSSALRLIGGPWFAETHNDPNDKDFYVCLQGKLLIEIAELDSFSKAETTSIKRLLSCQEDRFRIPYGKVSRDFPRQGMFVGTTNEGSYLKDTTGNRRFWPVKTSNIDLDLLARDRDVLFAEALYMLKQGYSWWEVPDVEAKAEQEARRQVDEWESVIGNYLDNLVANSVTVLEVATKVVNIKIQDMHYGHQRRIANCIMAAGWIKKHTMRGNVYSRP